MTNPIGRFVLTTLLAAVSSLPAQTNPRGTKPLVASPAPTGESLYRSYCASCHGMDGKGSGPAADSFRMRPTDLTLLSQRNGGEFPAYKLGRLLGGADELPAHGSRRMPVWGPGLNAPGGAAGKTTGRELLLEFIRRLQVRSPSAPSHQR